MGTCIHSLVQWEMVVSTPETSASPLPVIQPALNEIVREMGFTKLKPKQLEAIAAVVSGNDTFVSLPMGYGKSVVYGVLPPLFDKLRGNNLWKAMADRRSCWSCVRTS